MFPDDLGFISLIKMRLLQRQQAKLEYLKSVPTKWIQVFIVLILIASH